MGWLSVAVMKMTAGKISADIGHRVAQRWPGFLERFGDLAVEAPVSDAMQSFLARHSTPTQRAALITTEAPTD